MTTTPLKAWRITWSGIPDEAGIYVAQTRGKAMAKALTQLSECGWKATLPELRCRRAPEYDQWAARQMMLPGRMGRRGITEECVRVEA